jgi:chromosome segregation ATPase
MTQGTKTPLVCSLAEADEIIAARDARIVELETKLTDAIGQLSEVDEERSAQCDVVQRIERERDDALARIAQLETKLDRSESVVVDLNRQVNRLETTLERVDGGRPCP